MEWNAHNSLHLNTKTQKWYITPNICKQGCTKMMQVPPMPSLLISYTIFQILLSLDCRLESHSDAISPDFLYDLPDVIVARLSTGIPRLPPNVMDRSGEHYQTFNSTDFRWNEIFNSPDFYGKKCTQLSPRKYKNSTLIQETENLQTRLYRNDASSSDAISPDFLYDLPDLIVARLLTGIPLRCHLSWFPIRSSRSYCR